MSTVGSISTEWSGELKLVLDLIIGEVVAPGARIFETLESDFQRIEPNHKKLVLCTKNRFREMTQ